MEKEARAIFKVLSKTYPDVRCELDFTSHFELLVATVLSAQCTDKRVNQITPQLFKRYGTPKKMAGADLLELEEIIRPLGFFHSKARSLQGLSKKLLFNFEGVVPDRLEDLITLPGVGRKTANVVLGHGFNIPGITVDTHFGRLARRFGWTTSEDPVRVEHEVGALLPPKDWIKLSGLLILHGRRICHSRRPACAACPLSKLCPSYGMGEMDRVKALSMVKVEADFQ